jgi:hypothetical protein
MEKPEAGETEEKRKQREILPRTQTKWEYIRGHQGFAANFNF